MRKLWLVLFVFFVVMAIQAIVPSEAPAPAFLVSTNLRIDAPPAMFEGYDLAEMNSRATQRLGSLQGQIVFSELPNLMGDRRHRVWVAATLTVSRNGRSAAFRTGASGKGNTPQAAAQEAFASLLQTLGRMVDARLGR